MTSLRDQLIKLAHANPEMRDVLLPLVREAKEHASPKALKQYLKDHPKADPKNHSVKKTEGKNDKPKGSGGSRSLKNPKGGEHKVMSTQSGNAVFMGSYTSDHIKKHITPGSGSVFSSNVDIGQIADEIANTPKDFFEGGGGVHTFNVPGAGQDLVKKISDIRERYPDAREVEIEKQEGVVMEDGRPKRDDQGNVIPNMVKAKAFVLPEEDDGGDWTATDQVNVVMRPMNPQFMPDEAKEDDQIKQSLDDNSGFAVLTTFPGNPDVPKTSQWGEDWAAVIPNGGKGTEWEQKGKKAFRAQIIRLAHTKPELRKYLLPLL